jgi:hypothetical protein
VRAATVEAHRMFSLALSKKTPERWDYLVEPIRLVQPGDRPAIHNATMVAARRLAHVETIPQQDGGSNMLNKLARTFASQVEAPKKYRSAGEQTIKIQHVTVNEGGQAIVDNVRQGVEVQQKMETNLMDLVQRMNAAPRCSATSKRSRRQCKAPAVRRWKVCRFHGARGGAPKRQGLRGVETWSLHGRRSDVPAAVCGLTAECSQDNWQVMALPLSEPQRQGPAWNRWVGQMPEVPPGEVGIFRVCWE